MNNEKLYIAYGSNMNKSQMARRCPNAKPIGTAIIKGYELTFRGVANIEPKNDASVPVAVWSITSSDERSLDVYEGYPHLYIKQFFEIVVNGETVTAMAYVMLPGKRQGTPTDYYFGVIEEGYIDFGIDTKPLFTALERSVCKAENQSETLKARTAVAKYAKRQMKEHLPCPRCGRDTMKEKLSTNALSRRANIYVCDGCGTDEAMRDFAGYKDELTDWCAAKKS